MHPRINRLSLVGHDYISSNFYKERFELTPQRQRFRRCQLNQIQPEQVDVGRDCRTVSRDPILRRERVHNKYIFPCSAFYEQDWQPYPIDACSYYRHDHTMYPCFYWFCFVSVFFLSSIPCTGFAKNQNAPGPSEHPPGRGQKMSKRSSGIKGCKYKNCFLGIVEEHEPHTVQAEST